MKCDHIWEEDERFKEGGVTMLFGTIGNVQEETRMICKNCGSIKYVPKLKEVEDEN